VIVSIIARAPSVPPLVLSIAAARTVIECQQHDGNQRETFDPRRTGFDHMAFKVDTRADLDEWLARFEQLGVSHSPIAEREYGAVLAFKDPGGIQFEMFFKADHP
jgi:glyoxylase I family protein